MTINRYCGLSLFGLIGFTQQERSSHMIILIWMVSMHPIHLHYIVSIAYISIRSYLLEYTVLHDVIVLGLYVV